MKMILFSGGDYHHNKKLNDRMFELTGVPAQNIQDIVMVYVPSMNDEHGDYFQEWKRFYKKLGVKKFHFFPLKKSNPKSLVDKVMNAHIIFFSGGNTFTFLRNMRRSGLRNNFKQFLARGGVLSGMSAGSILMTPNIMLAKIPSYDQDPNEAKVTNLKALNLLPFEFSPHYEPKDGRLDIELKKYSKTRKHPIFGCEDGAGIVFHGGLVETVGKLYFYQDGRKNIIAGNTNFSLGQ
jgi:dipeptidase E